MPLSMAASDQPLPEAPGEGRADPRIVELDAAGRAVRAWADLSGRPMPLEAAAPTRTRA